MKSILDPVILKNLELKNHIIRSATFEYDGANENGSINNKLLEYYQALSEGEIGLIITGMMAVDEYSRHNAGMVNIFDSKFISDFSNNCR